MGHETPSTSSAESHAVLLRLRRTTLGPQPATDRRAAVPGLPRDRQSAPRARCSACPDGGRRGRFQPRTDCRADRVVHARRIGSRRRRHLPRPGDLRRRADASRSTRTVRRAYEERIAVQAARPRRRPLLATRRRAASAPGDRRRGAVTGTLTPSLCRIDTTGPEPEASAKGRDCAGNDVGRRRPLTTTGARPPCRRHHRSTCHNPGASSPSSAPSTAYSLWTRPLGNDRVATCRNRTSAGNEPKSGIPSPMSTGIRVTMRR